MPNLVKSVKGIYPFGANFYKKNTNFGDFMGCKPTFLKPKGLNLALGCGPVTSSPMQNFVIIA